MKKLLFIAICLVLVSATVSAQRYAIIDTKYILDKMPEYKDADKRLATMSELWQREIDEKQTQLNQMYKNFDAEQYMLTDELKKKREDQLFNMEKDIRDLQKKRFGYEGDLFKERQKLVKPVQDKIWDAADKVAKQNNLAIIFDKAGELVMIYTDPRYDYTDFVLDELGLGDPNDKVKN